MTPLSRKFPDYRPTSDLLRKISAALEVPDVPTNDGYCAVLNSHSPSITCEECHVTIRSRIASVRFTLFGGVATIWQFNDAGRSPEIYKKTAALIDANRTMKKSSGNLPTKTRWERTVSVVATIYNATQKIPNALLALLLLVPGSCGQDMRLKALQTKSDLIQPTAVVASTVAVQGPPKEPTPHPEHTLDLSEPKEVVCTSVRR